MGKRFVSLVATALLATAALFLSANPASAQRGGFGRAGVGPPGGIRPGGGLPGGGFPGGGLPGGGFSKGVYPGAGIRPIGGFPAVNPPGFSASIQFGNVLPNSAYAYRPYYAAYRPYSYGAYAPYRFNYSPSFYPVYIPYNVGIAMPSYPLAIYSGSLAPSVAIPQPQVAPADRPPPDNLAHLQLTVPANAEILIDGTATTQTGTTREFVSPPLEPGSKYVYKITVRYADAAGKVIEDSRDVRFQANDWFSVDFTRPPPPPPAPAPQVVPPPKAGKDE